MVILQQQSLKLEGVDNFVNRIVIRHFRGYWVLFVTHTVTLNIPLLWKKKKNGKTESFVYKNLCNFSMLKSYYCIRKVHFYQNILSAFLQIIADVNRYRSFDFFSAFQIKIKSWLETILCYALLKHESHCETTKAMMYFHINKPSYWHDIKDKILHIYWDNYASIAALQTEIHLC